MKSGGDRVHRNAGAPGLSRQRLRETDQRCLGGGIDREADESVRGDDRRDVDHASASLGHHAPHDIFAHEDGRKRVEADQGLDVAVRHGSQHAGRSDAGIVDKSVNRSDAPAQVSHEDRNRGRIAEIKRVKGQRPGTDLGGQGREGVAVATGDGRDPKSLAREPLGDRKADAPAGARDDDIIHPAPAFPRPSTPGRRRSEARRGPCAQAGGFGRRRGFHVRRPAEPCADRRARPRRRRPRR